MADSETRLKIAGFVRVRTYVSMIVLPETHTCWKLDCAHATCTMCTVQSFSGWQPAALSLNYGGYITFQSKLRKLRQYYKLSSHHKSKGPGGRLPTCAKKIMIILYV